LVAVCIWKHKNRFNQEYLTERHFEEYVTNDDKMDKKKKFGLNASETDLDSTDRDSSGFSKQMIK
jgi:hypothetical protein